VYGRYHYLTDAVSGILVGMLVVRLSPYAVTKLTDVAERIRALRAEPAFQDVEYGPKASFSDQIRPTEVPSGHDTFLTEPRTVNDSIGGGTA